MSEGKSVRTHKDLEAWKMSMELVEKVYRLTKSFPKEEQYGITSQMRRAAISIPSNIAEGASRNSDKEFIQFLYVSSGSLSELETQLLLSKRLGLMDQNEIFDDVTSIKKMLFGLIRFLKAHKS